jgi:hypothetical protein
MYYIGKGKKYIMAYVGNLKIKNSGLFLILHNDIGGQF